MISKPIIYTHKSGLKVVSWADAQKQFNSISGFPVNLSIFAAMIDSNSMHILVQDAA